MPANGFIDLLLAGEDQSQADQPNSLAEGPTMQIKIYNHFERRCTHLG
jgi:hypothetical protein